MALLQQLNMEERGGRVGVVPVCPGGGKAGPAASLHPVSAARSYLCIRRFCSEPLEIDVF